MKMLGLSLVLAAFANLATADDWTRFRGPNGSGVSSEKAALPVEFGPGNKAVWKVAVPFGRSSPVVAGGRVYLTASDENKLITLAFDASTGKQLWRRELDRARRQVIYKSNDPASPTPAVDDHGVYVFFADFGLVSYALADGRERWRAPLGPFNGFYGMGTSPVVAPGGLVLLLCDQAKGSYLLALDRDTGKQRWKTERKQHLDGWAAPIVHKDEVLTYGSTRVDAYQLSTGESHWWIPLSSAGSMGNPVINGDTLLLAADGSDQPWLPSFEAMLDKLDKNSDKKISLEEAKDEKDWIEHFGWVDTNSDQQLDAAEWQFARALGTGDYGAMAIPIGSAATRGRVDPSAIRWRYKRGVSYVSAPLLYDGVFYMVKNGGILTALDPATGKLLKQGRTDKARGEYFSSPVAGDGKVYLVNEEGKMTVLKAGAQWEVLAVNDLGEECYATPALTGGRMYVRTRGTLYAFEEPKTGK